MDELRKRYREDDIELLLPSWREKVRALIARMRQLGFQPLLFDGLRTFEEAASNAKTKRGVADSVHCYGVAADLICNEHGWSCEERDPKTKRPLYGCQFFAVLGREAESAGMVWGGRFMTWRVVDGVRKRVPKADMPHVQGIAIARESALRALGTSAESVAARDALVREHFGRRS